ncbi:MAG: BatA domain-containing protein [Trueperaceae bacterium]|nr:BatA domain-containing protein [Trueperaceae bacterium]
MTLSFAAPAFLWLLATLPVVVLLHFLRARTRRVEVSALFLWQQARSLAERRRRWSPTWSLLAQLLAVSAAALALAQPDLRMGGPPDLVVVVDASASMAAVDPEGARLERALAVALAAADEAGRVAVVRAGFEPTLVQPFTLDRGEVRAAIEGVAPSDGRTDLDRAVALARDLAGDDAEILLVSDDPGPPRTGVVRANVAGSGENVGIVGFDLGIQQAFVAIASNASRPRSVAVELRQGERVLASTEVFIPAGDQATVTFPLEIAGGVVEARLLVETGDALGLDDVAYAGQRALIVVLDGPVDTMLRALNAVSGVAPRVTGAARTAPADVRVLVGADPDDVPAGDVIVLPAPHAEAEFRTIAAWDRADPLLRFVDLREVVVGLAPVVEGAAVESTAAPWRVLASTDDLRPVLRYREDSRGRVLHFMFHPSQSDLVFRPAFPTLVANALEAFRGEARVPLGVRDDDGRRVEQPGVVTLGGLQLVANLLEPTQTRLPRPAADDLEAARPPLQVERLTPIAGWLVAAALLFLIAEWVLWSRGAGALAHRPRRRRDLRRRA